MESVIGKLDLRLIIELLGQGRDPKDETAGARLEVAVASFATNLAGATNSIRQLQSSDPSGFALAAVRMLAEQTEQSPGARYLAELVFTGDSLVDPLLDEDALPVDAATSLARSLATASPLFDSHLMRKTLGNAGGQVAAIRTSKALRVLLLVEAISDCSRLSSYLIQFLRHPSPEVRSKAALLLGRANLNLTRVRSLLISEDPRVRANAVESLWGHPSAAVRELLREAAKDSSPRASVNALLALCRQGDREACEQLRHLAASPDPVQRSRAAWAMGESGAREFAPLLDELAGDGNTKVRALAEKSRAKLQPPAEPKRSEAKAAPEVVAES